MPAPEGYLVVDKPPGWTSHDVVARCRKLLGTRRVGHAGTLDPAATGVLVVGVGRATRLLRYLNLFPKCYEGEVVLGVATTTLDAAGEVTDRVDMDWVDLSQARKAAVSLTGRIEQVPPMVSALKVGGRRLHQLAREGREVERAARRVDVFRFDILGTTRDGALRIAVDCSSGTYVRVLASDLGRRLSGVAHLRALRRVAVGSFTLDEALALETVQAERVLPAGGLVRDLPAADLSEGDILALVRGRFLDRSSLGLSGEGPWALFSEEGRLVGVGEARGRDRVKPAVVLAGAGDGLG